MSNGKIPKFNIGHLEKDYKTEENKYDNEDSEEHICESEIWWDSQEDSRYLFYIFCRIYKICEPKKKKKRRNYREQIDMKGWEDKMKR